MKVQPLLDAYHFLLPLNTVCYFVSGASHSSLEYVSCSPAEGISLCFHLDCSLMRMSTHRRRSRHQLNWTARWRLGSPRNPTTRA